MQDDDQDGQRLAVRTSLVLHGFVVAEATARLLRRVSATASRSWSPAKNSRPMEPGRALGASQLERADQFGEALTLAALPTARHRRADDRQALILMT